MNPESCPICNNKAFNSIWQWHDMQNGCCSACGHVYSVISNAQEDNYQTFEQKYPDEFLLDEQNEIFSIAQRRFASAPNASGRALEIGCGYGHFLRFLKDNGMETIGIEPSVPQSDFAKKHFGLQVETGIYEGKDGVSFNGNKSYDLIAAFHVLEHVGDIQSFLSKIYADLNDNGCLMLAVPVLESLPIDFTELYFIARGWHRHTFQKCHLIWLLERHGFHITETIEELPTRMSPSSLLIIAQKSNMTNDQSLIPSSGCDIIKEFHHKLERMRLMVKSVIREWVHESKNIAFYGGGTHTEAVFSLCGLSSAEVMCVIDDDLTKQGGKIEGVPIVSPCSEQAKECNVVVVSSLASESYLVPELREKSKNKMVVGFYQDLVKYGSVNDG